MSSRDDNWKERAKCRGVIQKIECTHGDDEVAEHDIFYPPRCKACYKDAADTAKAICNGRDLRPECPVRLQCLWAAISGDERHGIWGGMSHREWNAAIRRWKSKYPDREKTLKEFVMDGLK